MVFRCFACARVKPEQHDNINTVNTFHHVMIGGDAHIFDPVANVAGLTNLISAPNVAKR